MEYTFVLLSGGVGSRMQNAIPKQYMLLAGKPMIMHVLEKIDMIEEIKKVVIVCSDEYRSLIELMLIQYNICKQIEFAVGGKNRQASVLSGLKAVNTNSVIIHEAARPFVTVEDYKEVINDDAENVMSGINIPFTVLKGRKQIEEILDRSELINVQLPQKFNTNLILEAHLKAEADNKTFTEDSSLFFNYHPGIKIKVIQGREYNIKITTRLDMLTGEIIYDEIFKRRK